MPEINEYISIMNAVKETELPRTTIVELIDSETIEVSNSIVTGRTMILRTSLDAWFNDYILANKSLSGVLADVREVGDGVQDYLVATYKNITGVEFTDVSDPPRVLANQFEFYQSVLDTATYLVD